jgi:hypothetical protein
VTIFVLHYFPAKAGTDGQALVLQHEVLQVFRRTDCMRGENSVRYVTGSEYSRCDGDWLRAISGTRLQMADVGNPLPTLAMWVNYLHGE